MSCARRNKHGIAYCMLLPGYKPLERLRACLYDPTQPGRDERWDHFDVLK